ncbi:MAG: DUF4293 domain-containing protein [Bacteroidales bacterium]|nr:DUF4293 domain-containing protein [Bacteroidales bacterium]
MWQRYQTLLLAVATLLVASLFWCNIANVLQADGSVEHIAYTSRPVFKIWLVLLTVLHVLALGGYKWRMKQIRVVIFTAIVTLGFQLWLLVYYFQTRDSQIMSWTALFPLLACALDVYAARNILMDEFLVQSAKGVQRSKRKKKEQK